MAGAGGGTRYGPSMRAACALLGSLAAAAAKGTPKPGNCGVTDQDMSPHACDHKPTGSWNATAVGITDLAGCVARCKTCSQCNYVSYNPSSQGDDPPDCSWYRTCDMHHLAGYAGYTSEKVSSGPPPPPPPPPPPERVTVSLPLDARASRNVTTIATIEVDVMPFLGRKSNGKKGGGPHE